MEKSYNALLDRLERSYNYNLKLADRLEAMPDLNESELQDIAVKKAIAKHLARILEVERAG